MKIHIVYESKELSQLKIAHAIKDAIESRQGERELELIDVNQIFASRVPQFRWESEEGESEFFNELERAWTLLSEKIGTKGWFINKYLDKEHPDIIILVESTLGGCIKKEIDELELATNLVTICSEYAYTKEAPSLHEPMGDYYLIGRSELVDDFIAHNLPEERILPLSGVPVDINISKVWSQSKEELRHLLGLNPRYLTVLVEAESMDRKEINNILKGFEGVGEPLQILFHSPMQVNGEYGEHRLIWIEETKNLINYKASADILIGTANSSFVSEAIELGIPVMLSATGSTRDAGIIKWVEKHEAGIAFSKSNEIARAIEQLCDESTFNFAGQNWAAQEVADFIEQLELGSKRENPTQRDWFSFVGWAQEKLRELDDDDDDTGEMEEGIERTRAWFSEIVRKMREELENE